MMLDGKTMAVGGLSSPRAGTIFRIFLPIWAHGPPKIIALTELIAMGTMCRRIVDGRHAVNSNATDVIVGRRCQLAITSAEMQTALGDTQADAKVLQHVEPIVGLVQRWYIVGNLDAPGRAKWVETTAADNAATQAAAAITALKAN